MWSKIYYSKFRSKRYLTFMLFLFHNPPLWLFALILVIPFSILLAGRGIYVLSKRRYRVAERKLAIVFLTVLVVTVCFQLFLPNDVNPVVALSIPFGIIAFLLNPLFSDNHSGFFLIVPLLIGVTLNICAIVATIDLFLTFIKPRLT